MSREFSQRERRVLIGGGLVLALLLIVFGGLLPYQAAIERLDKQILSRRGQLQEVRQLQAEYLDLKQRAGRLKRNLGKGTSAAPLTFLEEAASRIAGRENLTLMRPLPEAVQCPLRIEATEFKLEQLTLEQTLRILQTIEQAQPPMRVDRLHLKQRFDNATRLDMNATVSAARRM